MSAGLGLVRLEPIDPQIAIVANGEPHVFVEHAKPVRHVLQRGVKQKVLLLQLLLMTQSLGDVFAGRDPTAVRQRSRLGLNNASIASCKETDASLAAADFAHPPVIKGLRRHSGAMAARYPVLNDLAVGYTGLDDLGI